MPVPHFCQNDYIAYYWAIKRGTRAGGGVGVGGRGWGVIVKIKQMQSPVKLNKINPRLSGSRREEKSYTERYKQKGRPAPRSPGTPHGATSQQVSLRGERIMELVAVGCDPSTIRIEQQADEYQIMKNEYMETQLLWSKMSTQTRNDIHDLREQIKNEQKTIKDMEKVLTSKRAKLTTLQDRLDNADHLLQNTPEEHYDHFIAGLQEEYDTIDAIGEREMAAARQECGQLEAEGRQLDECLRALETDIGELADFSPERYNSRLSELLQEEQLLRAQVVEMEREGEQIWRGIRELQAQRPIKEQVHRKYLELYEKMFINSELDKMEGLLEQKEKEMKHLEDYGKRKGLYRERRKEIEQIEQRIMNFKKELTQLELDVRDRSTTLLNLHTAEPQKR